MPTNEHGYCPHCGADMDGGSIWETGLTMLGNEKAADDYAAGHGATRTSGNWSRRRGIYDVHLDKTVRWACPDCNGEWECEP